MLKVQKYFKLFFVKFTIRTFKGNIVDIIGTKSPNSTFSSAGKKKETKNC
jgi:hypothetical protein